MKPEDETSVIHQQFLAIAPTLNGALAKVIALNGPLTLTSDQSVSFPQQLCRAIAGQQLSTKAAHSIWNRVLTSAGDTPLTQYLRATTPDTLRSCGLSNAKAKAMIGIAHAAQAGQLEASELTQMSTAERTQRLTALWGVGQWTADMMSIFYFADPDIWPDGDVTARKTLEKLTSKRRKTTKTATLFAPYRSYLALHMWRYVDAGEPL